MKKGNTIIIRDYKKIDAQSLADIYFYTIHNVNQKDYTNDQLKAWAPSRSLKETGWELKWDKLKPLVAEIDGVPVGFVEFEKSGHIDCFYVHHEFQGQGVGKSLMAEVFNQAKSRKITKIFAEVSITAKPFFISCGFTVVKEQSVNCRGVSLTNFIMEKIGAF